MLTRADGFAWILSIILGVNTQCTGPDINRASLELIKEFEGFISSPYSDPVGYPTVGYGHLCSTSECHDVDFPFPLSEETGTQLLAIDVIVCLAPFASLPLTVDKFPSKIFLTIKNRNIKTVSQKPCPTKSF